MAAHCTGVPSHWTSLLICSCRIMYFPSKFPVRGHSTKFSRDISIPVFCSNSDTSSSLKRLVLMRSRPTIQYKLCVSEALHCRVQLNDTQLPVCDVKSRGWRPKFIPARMEDYKHNVNHTSVLWENSIYILVHALKTYYQKFGILIYSISRKFIHICLYYRSVAHRIL